MKRYFTLSYVKLYYGIIRYVTLSYFRLRYGTFSYITLHSVMLCYFFKITMTFQTALIYFISYILYIIFSYPWILQFRCIGQCPR